MSSLFFFPQEERNKGKAHILPSNYHLIDNVPPNFQLGQCLLANYQKIDNVTPKTSKKKKKNVPKFLSIKQKYPYKFEIIKTKNI
jgi:hypothetical protein